MTDSKVLNTRKFNRISRESFFAALNKLTTPSSQILILQPRVVSLMNSLFSFSQLTESTRVTKVVALDDDSLQAIEEILSNARENDPPSLVFVVDIRADLRIPQKLIEVLENIPLPSVDLLYVTWKYDSVRELNGNTGLPLHIQSQLPQSITCHVGLQPWDVLPLAYIDDNLLTSEILFNSRGENLYFPTTESDSVSTRKILVDNLVNSITTVLLDNDLNITHALSIGGNSHKLIDLLRERIETHMTAQELFIKETVYGDKHSGLQCNMIVIERDMDLVTPLLSQLSYAGIIDDFYALDKTKLSKLTYNDLSDDDSVGDIFLKYTEDDIWNDLKFYNFGAVGPQLNQIAKDLQVTYDSRHQAESVGEIKEFVDKLGELQQYQKSLKLHTGISSRVLSQVKIGEGGDGAEDEESLFNRTIELEQDFIADNYDNKTSCDKILELLYEGDLPKESIFRLCCLLSLAKNGIRDKEFQILKTEIVDTYGIEVLFTLEKLTKYGWFVNKSSFLSYSHWKDFRSFSNALNLLPQNEDDVNPSKPMDANFAYGGIVPITTRIVQSCFDRSVVSKSYSSQQPFIISRTPTWFKLDEMFVQQYGPDVVREQIWDSSASSKTKIIGSPNRASADTAFIVFIGGVSLGEVATLQYVSKKLKEKGINKRFIIVTDGVINGEKLVKSVLTI